MGSFEVRSATANDIPVLVAMDHSVLSDYVWQVDVKTEVKQLTVEFHEVRLPRSISVIYPQDPSNLKDEWTKKDIVMVANQEVKPVGYICAVEERVSSLVRITDLVVAPEFRRQGAASELLTVVQSWASERGTRRIIIEMQSKNHPGIRLAQKSGYEFCGYNDKYFPTQDVALYFGRKVR